jgi:hypothetical protein
MSCWRSCGISAWTSTGTGWSGSARALSAEEVAGPIVAKLKLDDDMTVDWVWISLTALWQRWWPDRPGLELLDGRP